MVENASKPSFVTRTVYVPGARSGAVNFPSAPEVSASGPFSVAPAISIFAPGTTAPDESFTVPERVSAASRAPVSSVASVTNAASATHKDARRLCAGRECRGLENSGEA